MPGIHDGPNALRPNIVSSFEANAGVAFGESPKLAIAASWFVLIGSATAMGKLAFAPTQSPVPIAHLEKAH